MKPNRNPIQTPQTTITSAEGQPAIPGRLKVLLPLSIFIMALLVRLSYLKQISGTPFFSDPYASAKLYLEWARQILSGEWHPYRIPFLSSILYPYWLAFLLKISGNSVPFVRLVQIIVGALNCVLFYRLTSLVLPGRWLAAWIAGLASAFYGFLVFQDAELLMAPLTFALVNASLILTLKARTTGGRFAGWAGICLGLACHDRTNLLLFVPVAVWFLGNGLTTRPWAWKPVRHFILGISLAVLPVTVLNATLGHDRVLLSANAGVNFFIGNNPEAPGIFYLPPASGLDNADLEASARRTACQATKKDLKPSAVSAYWSHQAWSFIRLHPGQAISLWGRKFLLFWTRFDIPNSTNFYFIRSEFAPVLYLAFIGFWLVGPLGLTGLALRLANRTREQDKFLAAFVGIYTLSLLPFFMADRYRLPVIAVLTAYAVLAVWEARAWIKSKSVSRLLVWGMVLAAAELLVNVPWIYPSFLNYSNDRLWVAGQYINRSLANPQAGYQDLARGFLELKQSLETDPYSPDGYYDLGLAYTHVGCHSGAVRELSRALELQPNSPRIQQALQAAQKKLLATGDTLAEDKLPRTIFEQALDEEDHHHTEAAIALYQAAIEKDPFHFDACQHLGTLLFQSGKMQEAITVLQQGAAANPMHLPTWNNLAVAYSQTGDLANARRALRICLELKPDDPVYLQQLRKLDDSSGRTR